MRSHLFEQIRQRLPHDAQAWYARLEQLEGGTVVTTNGKAHVVSRNAPSNMLTDSRDGPGAARGVGVPMPTFGHHPLGAVRVSTGDDGLFQPEPRNRLQPRLGQRDAMSDRVVRVRPGEVRFDESEFERQVLGQVFPMNKPMPTSKPEPVRRGTSRMLTEG